MNKKWISVAVGAVLAGATAITQADVTLFGQVDLSVDARDIDGVQDDINMNSNRTSVGVKGFENLGDNLRGIFMLDFKVDADDEDIEAGSFNESGPGFVGRDTWVGLESGLGNVRLGTISTSYKEHGALIDPFNRTALDGRNTGLQSSLHDGKGDSGEGRATNTIRYDTPRFGTGWWTGLGASGHYTLDNDEDDGEDNDAWGVGVSYISGPFIAYADYLTNDTDIEADDDNNEDEDDFDFSSGDEAYKVGGQFTFGGGGQGSGYSIFGQYEFDEGLASSLANSSMSGGGDGLVTSANLDPSIPVSGEGDLWHAGASANLGNAIAYLAYGQRDEDDDNNNSSVSGEYEVYTIAGAFKFSQRTMAYVGFSQLDFEDDIDLGETDLFSLGVQHKF